MFVCVCVCVFIMRNAGKKATVLHGEKERERKRYWECCASPEDIVNRKWEITQSQWKSFLEHTEISCNNCVYIWLVSVSKSMSVRSIARYYTHIFRNGFRPEEQWRAQQKRKGPIYTGNIKGTMCRCSQCFFHTSSPSSVGYCVCVFVCCE